MKLTCRRCENGVFSLLTNEAPVITFNENQIDSFHDGGLIITKEDGMIEVTESATKQIAEYFNGKEVSPIRIFLNEGG